MKICVITDSLFRMGGAQRVVVDVLNRMIDDNDITVVMPFSNHKNIFKLDDRVKLVNLNELSGSVHKFYRVLGEVNHRTKIFNHRIFNGVMKKSIASKKKRIKFNNFLRENNFDVIVGVQATGLFRFSLIDDDIEARTVGWVHSTYDAYFNKRAYAMYGYESLVKEVAKKINHLIVLTQKDKNEFDKNFNINSDVMYNPINIDRNFAPQERDKDKLLFIGRVLINIKGLDRIITIMKKIIAIRPNIHLDIVGDGTDFQKVKSMIEENNLQNNITMVGRADDLVDYYSKSKLLLMTSRWEGMSMSVLEAFSYALPAVSFHTNGTDEIITDGKEGYLVDQGNIDTFVSKILELLDDENKWNEMSKNCYERANDFDMEVIIKKFENMLEN